MQATRAMSLSKVPGVAETLDWATALVALEATHLDREIVAETMGCFLKDEADMGTFRAELEAGRLEMVDGTATPQVE